MEPLLSAEAEKANIDEEEKARRYQHEGITSSQAPAQRQTAGMETSNPSAALFTDDYHVHGRNNCCPGVSVKNQPAEWRHRDCSRNPPVCHVSLLFLLNNHLCCNFQSVVELDRPRCKATGTILLDLKGGPGSPKGLIGAPLSLRLDCAGASEGDSKTVWLYTFLATRILVD